MGKYTEDSRLLLEYIGGRENIGAVSHCVTRMRFVLNDPKKADIKKIESLKSVRGTFTQAGQFQVIIGNTVNDFYNDFVEVAGVSGVSKAEVKNAAKSNQNALQRIMTNLAEIFAPLIPAIIVGGLILGFRNIIDSMPVFQGGHTLVELSQFWAGLDHFLWLIGEAVFHVGIPVGICWSITKKMGTTEMLGIVLGLTLVSGQLMNAYSVAGATAEDWVSYSWNFGFAAVKMRGYQAQVIPAILAAFCLVYLEKFFRKITPAVVSMIVVPFCSLLLSVVAAHFILGPIGWWLGSIISKVVYAGITGPGKVIFGGVFGFVYAPLVITGLHHMTNAIDLQLIADYGGTMLWPMIALSNIAQGSAVLAMCRLQKNDAAKQEVNIPSTISCYLGVTEPAIFGVNLKYSFPFFCGMIGSALAAVVSVATNSTANAIGVGGLPGILSMQSQSWGTFAVAMLIAVVVPFALTMVVGSRRGVREEANQAKLAEDAAVAAGGAGSTVAAIMASVQQAKEPVELAAFLDGEIVPMKDVPDEVFASLALGNGIAIEPTSHVLKAPADAVVTVTMEESNHAVGLTLDNGVEILLHIGLDTVAMNGEGFTSHVKDGDRVTKGQKLITFDPAAIRAAGHPVTTMLVITEDNGVGGITFAEGGSQVKASEDTVVYVK